MRHRVLVLGGPKVGKTTLARALARELGVSPCSTDELVGKGVDATAVVEVASWLDEPGVWVVEGVTTARALRLWLAEHPEGLPAERFYYSGRAKARRKLKGQRAMAKGVKTVWRQIRAELVARQAEIYRF